MSTEMTNPNTTDVLADVEGFAGFTKAVETAAADRPTSAGGIPLLRMGTDGMWIYGAENTEVQANSRWVIDPRSLARGFVCWTRWTREELKAGKKNQLMGEVFVPMSAVRPERSALPQHFNEDTGNAWSWDDAMAVSMTCQNGEDRGLQVLYKVSSVGGIRALNDFFEKMQANMASGKVVPEITLGSDHYDHRDYGKTYTPEFTYIDWRLPGPGCGLPGPGLGLIDYDQSGKTIEDKLEPEAEAEAEAPVEKPKPRGRTRPAA